MGLTRHALNPRTDAFESARGRVVVTTHTPRVIATVFAGYLEIELTARMIVLFNDVLADGRRPHVFHDWSGMTGYDSESRTRLTRWLLRTRHEYGSVNLYVTSKLVAMGVAVANVTVGGAIHAFSDRARFDAALATAAREYP